MNSGWERGGLISHLLLKNSIYLALFLILIILLQTGNYIFIATWAAVALLLFLKSDREGRLYVLTTIIFGVGLFVYLNVKDLVILGVQSKEATLFLNRLSLLFILIPLLLFSLYIKAPLINYWKRPNWKGKIQFPFIWSGSHNVSIKKFLAIALAINTVVMMPFIIMNGWNAIVDLLWLAIIFSFTNAILEEMIWRGVLLSRFTEQLGEKWAVIITSLGFGLQHYSLGFPWPVCIGFAFGGLFYAMITLNSRSILPAIIWHIFLNFLMVFSGLIGN